MSWENDMVGVQAGPVVNEAAPVLSNVQFAQATPEVAPKASAPSFEAFLNPSMGQ
ncbi:MAG: hypothetical protein AB7E85_06360 [Pseudobdellovibrionaceae bacterium]